MGGLGFESVLIGVLDASVSAYMCVLQRMGKLPNNKYLLNLPFSEGNL